MEWVKKKQFEIFDHIERNKNEEKFVKKVYVSEWN